MSETVRTLPALFPGGTAVTRLRVYSGASVDGLEGGTPHLHTASTEGYVVIAGRGALQTITGSGFGETDLEPGGVVWFTPGTVHRVINRGGLDILCVMANAGLPEAGDAVMTFPDEILADRESYRRAASLPGSATDAELYAAAHARRDLGVTGFLALCEAVDAGDFAPLARLHERAARLVRPRLPDWRETWDLTVAAETRATDAALADLADGHAPHLAEAVVREAPANNGAPRFGMCGRLSTYQLTTPLPEPAGAAGQAR